MNLQKIKQQVLKIHNDENGDIPVGQIMVIGLIAIPIVIALVTFRNEILEWLRTQLDAFKGEDTNPGL